MLSTRNITNKAHHSGTRGVITVKNSSWACVRDDAGLNVHTSQNVTTLHMHSSQPQSAKEKTEKNIAITIRNHWKIHGQSIPDAEVKYMHSTFLQVLQCQWKKIRFAIESHDIIADIKVETYHLGDFGSGVHCSSCLVTPRNMLLPTAALFFDFVSALPKRTTR